MTARHWVLSACSVLGLLVLGQAASGQQPTAALAGSAGPPPAFYRWSGEPPASPGRLLRQEALDERLALENASRAVRFLYSSESFSGAPTVVSAAAFLPAGSPPEGGWPVLAWSHGTVGLADLCAPSWRGRSPRDVAYLSFWLGKGYAIVATDYEGLGTPGPHPYLHCRAAALGNIDAVAAAQELGWPLSKQWLVTGQSQGGHGALCTGAHASGRAPGLEFVGTLATAPGVGFLKAYAGQHPEKDAPMRYLGVVLVNVRGMETFTPTFSAEQALSERARSLMHRVDETCVTELLREGAALGLTTSTTFNTIPFSETPGIEDAVAQMEVPLGRFREPVLIAQGTKDSMTPFPLVAAYARDLCEAGTRLTFLVYPGEEHSGPMNVGRDDFHAWVNARFAGAPAADSCADLP
ncbi:MAG: lipase family protein [Myxococcota bacterium]|nr:lipase family protein [Myxococcota bacterium]